MAKRAGQAKRRPAVKRPAASKTKTKTKSVRANQVVVYLDERDAGLLERVVEKTGLPKTEVFRRGLRRLADETLEDRAPGFSLRNLVANATDDGLPPDVAERHDYYLYGGGYEKHLRETKGKDGRHGKTRSAARERSD